MKRGLVEWDQQELPRAVLETRVARAREALAAANLDAAVVYTSVGAPQVARYFTHFLPYWNQGVLVLPREGEPTLLVALSNRVVPWIKDSSALTDVKACRAPAAEAGKLLAERGAKRIGVADRGSFPYRALEELQRAAAPATVVDWPALTAEIALGADAEELRLRAHARRLAERALDELVNTVDGRSDHQIAGQLDLALRLGAAEDTLVLVGPVGRWPGLPTGAPLGERANVLCQVEYKGHWVLVGRTLGLPPDDHTAGEHRLAGLARAGMSVREVVAAARDMHGGELYVQRAGRGAPFVGMDEGDRLQVGDIVALLSLSPVDEGALYADTFAIEADGQRVLA